MGSDYGKQTIWQSGREIRVSAVPNTDHYKVGGVTIDWSLVAANPTNTTLPDGTIVPAGTKYLLYGTVLSRITASGKFAQADTGAGDGRQTVTNAKRGEAFVLDRSIIESEYASNTVGCVFDGGNVFESRLQIGGGGGQPTRQNFVDMFPNITFTKD